MGRQKSPQYRKGQVDTDAQETSRASKSPMKYFTKKNTNDNQHPHASPLPQGNFNEVLREMERLVHRYATMSLEVRLTC